jgi:tetratricopeptide (TPR) repeat protein
MFRGQELRLPNLFGRNKATPGVPNAGSGQQAAPNRFATGPGIQNRPTGPANPQRSAGMPRGMTVGSQPIGNRIQHVPQSTATRTVQTMHSPPPQRGNVRSQAAAQPLTPSQTAAAIPIPTRAAPTAPATTEAAPQQQSAGKSAAEKLAAQAHQWSTLAESEDDFTRIIETCRRARASQPSAAVTTYVSQLAAWALNRRGQLKAETGQIKEALLDFDDAIRADGKCWRAVHNRGVLLAQDGQFEKAFDDFNRTIEINADFAKAYSNRGALFVVANDLDAALADYGRAIELDPNLAIAHRGRGRVCHLLGRLDEAIGHYDAAVQLAPNDAYAVASRADLLTDLGRYVDSLAEYNRAIEMDPQSVHAFSGCAWLLATCPDSSVRDPELAIERARIAFELTGQADAVSYDTLAAAQASAGDFTSATKTVRQAIELAAAAERDVYHDRLLMYQQAKPYRIAPVRPITQASYESR